MRELICHHTYKWYGLATDLSVYDSHGVVNVPSADFLPDGATPGSGALHFASASSVKVKTGPAWKPLAGVRVECLARVDADLSHYQTFVDADDTFVVYAHNGYLFVTFRIDPSIPQELESGLLGTYKDGITFPGYRLPVNTWFRLALVHDGLTQMQISVDGEAVTWPKGVVFAVRSVGANGICIGNSHDGQQPLNGDLDEIKVWRLDPNRIKRAFLNRPIDKATADCWARYVQSMRAAFVKHPDCAWKLIDGIDAALDRWLRAVTAQGPETRQRFDEVRRDYAKSWREGHLAGPKMRTLIDDWCAWLRLVGISPEGDAAFLALKQSECWKIVERELAGIDCDPQAMALVSLLDKACAGGPTRPPRHRPFELTTPARGRH